MKKSILTRALPVKHTSSINRPFNTVPVVVEEYTEDGVRYKKTAGGKIYNADMYDKNFKVGPAPARKKGFKKAGEKTLPVITRANNLKRFVNG